MKLTLQQLEAYLEGALGGGDERRSAVDVFRRAFAA